MRFLPSILIGLLVLLWQSPATAQTMEIVGNGTATSCTEQALVTAVAGGGDIRFNCGAAPATITLTVPLDITAPHTRIDGAGLITLSGGNATRIIRHYTFGNIGSSTLILSNLTIINGRVSGNNTDANGGAISSIFQAANPAFKPTLEIRNVTFQNNQANLTTFSSGHAYDYGGGVIYSRGGTVRIFASTFIDNHANNAAGGAIHMLQSALSIELSRFEKNTARGSVPANSQGGAIYIDGLGGAVGSAIITRSSFSENTSYNSGGAIYVNMYENTNLFSVEESSFLNNAIVGGEGALGGAISGGSSSNGPGTGNALIRITDSSFANNSVKRTPVFRQCGSSGAARNIEDGSGGALAFAQRARISITNSTFSQNQALGSCFNANGGALYVVNNTEQFVITNSSFANNSAGWVGGAISNAQISGNPGGNVRNTIFWNNTATGIANFQQHCSSELDSVNSLQYPGRLTNGNYYNDVTCFKGKSAPDQTNLPDFRDAQLGPLEDHNAFTFSMAITAQSAAHDAANPNFCPYRDQRGMLREQGAGCDIGAYELIENLHVDRNKLVVGEPALLITVYGEYFTQQSIVLWNGKQRATQFLNSTTLQVLISEADLAQVGEVQLSVSDSSLAPTTVQIVQNLFQVHVPLVRGQL